MCTYWRYWVIATLVLAPSMGWAQPQVLSDQGGSTLYFSRPIETEQLRKIIHEQPLTSGPEVPGLVFPLTTERMKPGRVFAQSLGNAGHPPFVVVGYDPLSLSWIKRNHSLLKQTAAGALVVSAQNKRQWDELRKQLDPIPLHPVSGDALSRDLNIDRYPFYVNGGDIAQ